jgi:hypothetical protein
VPVAQAVALVVRAAQAGQEEVAAQSHAAWAAA